VDGWQYANRSYDLEPESPVVIETLAGAWQSVGAYDKAERLLLEGLEIAGENRSLKTSYFFLLLRQGRLEKAERLVREQFGDSVEALPENMQQYYYFQKGMIAIVKEDSDAARNYFESAMRDDSDQTWDGDQVMYATILSALHREAGNTVLAEQRLASAERSVRRARVNGADDAGIYYTESSIHALRGEVRAGLESLQMAYERGFRGAWLLEIDFRLESLHDDPQFTAIKQQIEKDIVQARAEVESFAVAAR
jgi:tetratricopeptide (TPR) repeat protein